MKRGYMDWDKTMLPPAVLITRRQGLTGLANRENLKAVIVYGDVYSADELSYFVNYAPYWCNTAAILINDETYLVTGHNNRVNPWISTLTGLTQDHILASGFKVPQRIVQLLSEHFPKGGAVGIIGKYVMSSIVSELLEAGFSPVFLDEMVSQLLKKGDGAYRETTVKAIEILRNAFACGGDEYSKGEISKVVAAEIEYYARRHGAMDIVLCTSDSNQAFGLPVILKDEGSRFTVFSSMQYLGVWVNYAKTFGADDRQAQAVMDEAAANLRPGKWQNICRPGFELDIRDRVASDSITSWYKDEKILMDRQIISLAVYDRSRNIYLENMYCVTDKGAVTL